MTRYLLEIRAPGRPLLVHELAEGVHTVSRRDRANIRIEHALVSPRVHGRFTVTAGGVTFTADASAEFPTKHGGRPIRQGESLALGPGQALAIGDAALTLVADPDPKSTAAPKRPPTPPPASVPPDAASDDPEVLGATLPTKTGTQVTELDPDERQGETPTKVVEPPSIDEDPPEPPGSGDGFSGGAPDREPPGPSRAGRPPKRLRAPSKYLHYLPAVYRTGTLAARALMESVVVEEEAPEEHGEVGNRDDDIRRKLPRVAEIGRFLLAFEEVWEEIEFRVDRLHDNYDAAACPPLLLPVLAGWLGLPVRPGMSESKLRELLRFGHDLAKLRGTAESIERALEIYGGWQSKVEESPGEHVISVKVASNDELGAAEREVIDWVIRRFKPAQVAYRLGTKRKERD